MEEKTIDIIIRKFYAVEVLAHVSHVNTRVGYHHEALGAYYGAVANIKDRVIEHLMGTGRLIKVNASILEIGNDITLEASTLCSVFCNYAEVSGDAALENMAAELEEATGVIKLKLMFS